MSVVIPTVLRPELRRAVDSVRRQNFGGPIELIVVVDLDHAEIGNELYTFTHRGEVIVTGGGRRGGGARQLGVDAATGDWVAFLDDDDEWLPGHIESLMQLAGDLDWNATDPVILASRARQVFQKGSRSIPGPIVPQRRIRRGERLEDYLFRRRSPKSARPSLFTSTLIVTRASAHRVQWDVELPRHQDWDWLLRAQRAGSKIVQGDCATCLIYVGSSGSVSASNDWAASLAWVAQAGSDWDPRTRCDFVAAQCLRYALTARSVRGVVACASAMRVTGRFPSLASLVLGLAGLLGRHNLQRAMAQRGVRSSCA